MKNFISREKTIFIFTLKSSKGKCYKNTFLYSF